MKNHSIDASTTVPAMVFLSLSMLSFAGYSAAQNEIDSEPTAETEIICYAAQNQWVCAPADEKQKAHNKAMKLVEKKQASQFDVDSSQVEIKTMDLNNDFDQQVISSQCWNQSRSQCKPPQITWLKLCNRKAVIR